MMAPRRFVLIGLVVILTFGFVWQREDSVQWIYRVRTSGHPLHPENVVQIVRSATESGIFGIEVDNDITGRYHSFLHPDEKLETLKRVAREAHRAGNRAFVYIAGLECITENAAEKGRSLFKDHP